MKKLLSIHLFLTFLSLVFFTLTPSLAQQAHNRSQIIVATDQNIHRIVQEQIAMYGNDADLNHIDVSRVTNMNELFLNSSFHGDISRWDVSNVKDFSRMFKQSSFSGDISKWNISKDAVIVDILSSTPHVNNKMAASNRHQQVQPSNLATIIAHNGNIREIIKKEINLYGKKADLNHIDVSRVTNMDALFRDSSFCGDISKWDVSNVTSMAAMFQRSMFNGNISEWKTGKVMNMHGMFSRSPFAGDVSGWDVARVRDFSYMFEKSQFSGDLSRWNISANASLSHILADTPHPQSKMGFSSAPLNTRAKIIATDENIHQLVKEQIEKSGIHANLNLIDVSRVTSLERLFYSSPFNGDISKWDVGNVKNMNATFLRSSFNGDISNWDVSNVTTMRSCFNQSKFNGDISKWDTSKVQNMSRMFMSSPFNSDISAWDVRQVKDMRMMFEGTRFNRNLSQWQVGADTDISKICSNRGFQSTLNAWEKRRRTPAANDGSQEIVESAGSPTMIGRVYDLAKTSDGKATVNLSGRSARESRRLAEYTCYDAVWEFYDEDWNPEVLKKYRVSDEPVYISHFYLPSILAQQLSSTLARKLPISAPYLMLFRAKVRAPQSGKFRFVGAGDDMLAVRLNNKVVLEAGFFLPSLFDPKLAKRSSTKRFYELKGNDKEYISFLKARKIPNRKNWSLVEYPGCGAFNRSLGGLTCGEVFTVKKGEVVTLEILYAEISGGASQFLLLIDDLSKKAKSGEQKIYNLFRTSAGLPDESFLEKTYRQNIRDGFPSYDKDSPVWPVMQN